MLKIMTVEVKWCILSESALEPREVLMYGSDELQRTAMDLTLFKSMFRNLVQSEMKSLGRHLHQSVSWSSKSRLMQYMWQPMLLEIPTANMWVSAATQRFTFSFIVYSERRSLPKGTSGTLFMVFYSSSHHSLNNLSFCNNYSVGGSQPEQHNFMFCIIKQS